MFKRTKEAINAFIDGAVTGVMAFSFDPLVDRITITLNRQDKALQGLNQRLCEVESMLETPQPKSKEIEGGTPPRMEAGDYIRLTYLRIPLVYTGYDIFYGAGRKIRVEMHWLTGSLYVCYIIKEETGEKEYTLQSLTGYDTDDNGVVNWCFTPVNLKALQMLDYINRTPNDKE